MKELVVVSGKGGTGKTSLVASFASLNEKIVLADCDVDASNLYLLLAPRVRERSSFLAGHEAYIREGQCTGCGECLELCRFGAVMNESGMFRIDPIACEGCGVCAHFCPEGAIDMLDRVSGEWFISDVSQGRMVHARLAVAAENSGKLVSRIRTAAREVGKKEEVKLIVVDGSPGIGCPVIASITGCDLVLAVTEPTLSGLHDLERVLDLARHFSIPAAVVVNKFDVNETMTREIEDFCRARNVQIAGRIPYSQEFMDAMIQGKSMVDYSDGPASNAVRSVWKETRDLLMKV